MPSGVMPHHQPCLLVWFLTIDHAFWCSASSSTMPVGVVPHYRPCLLVLYLIIHHAYWCDASLSAMPLLWCLTIDHAFWCSASSSTMPVGVISHYRPCLLAWYLTIGHAFWSIAIAINILRVECRWKKGGYKSGATCTEVVLYQTCLMIRCHSQICLLVQCNYIRHACWVPPHLRMFVKCCSIKQGIWSVTNPSDMPTGRMPLSQGCKTCRVPSWTPS